MPHHPPDLSEWLFAGFIRRGSGVQLAGVCMTVDLQVPADSEFGPRRHDYTRGKRCQMSCLATTYGHYGGVASARAILIV